MLAGLSEWRIFRVSIPQSRVSLDPEFRSIQNLPREILENRHFGDPVTRQPFRYQVLIGPAGGFQSLPRSRVSLESDCSGGFWLQYSGLILACQPGAGRPDPSAALGESPGRIILHWREIHRRRPAEPSADPPDWSTVLGSADDRASG